jgi:glycosyltransferase involved in cell wall biosynthesis
MRIGFICPNTILPLSNLRNLANEHCNGDIIICMDDDDYYPPMAVSHAVDMFNRYNRLIAGCSPIYMYDFFTDTLYKFNGFHNNHSTNNCIAYRKQYLENHRYEDNLDCAEEYSFTNGFTEPMIQLSAEKCIVASIHDNTVDKTAFITQNPGVTEVTDKHISDLIPTEIFEKMRAAFLL